MLKIMPFPLHLIHRCVRVDSNDTSILRHTLVYFVLTIFVLLCPSQVKAHHIRQIDTNIGSRDIPDIVTGGSVTLSANQIIDIVILGDGYIVDTGSGIDEKEEFFTDARDWYEILFGTGANDGIRPLTFLPDAFRVRAVFKASTQRASGPADADRNSYYRVKLKCSTSCSIDTDVSWWDDNDTVNQDFRNNLFDAVDEVSPLNTAIYPSDLDSGDLITNLADLYSNLYVVMLIRRMGDDGQPGGVAINVPRTSGTDRVRAATGALWQHEFFHAFSYLRDEYIGTRGSTATLNNHPDGSVSVFNISNLTYSNERCDLPWAHIAPGGLYNSNVNSLIGNLFVGGRQEQGVWHSEYNCLINGRHENYKCNVDASEPNVRLRDRDHLCFWCQEITAMRILEKTGQLSRAGDSTDINAKGITWFNLWRTSLRHDYYDHFNIATLIAKKNACYDTFSGKACPENFPNCQDACNSDEKPVCLRGCTIRDIGNAMFVDSSAADVPDGSRWKPYTDIPAAISESYSNTNCTDPHLIVIKPGSYEGPITYETPSTWLADGCSTVAIGD